MNAPLRMGALTALVIMMLAGCDRYPPAERVVACAALRVGHESGTFSWKKLSGSQEQIIYQDRDGPDRAIVIYDRRHGPVTVHQEISFGNHPDIKGGVEAIRYCAAATGKGQDPAP